jgi:hypothetical protein
MLKTTLIGITLVGHAGMWGGSHWYFSEHPRQILVVVDSSYDMRNHYVQLENWLADFSASRRYSRIQLGTDKLELGPLEDIKNLNVLTRSAFGRFNQERFNALYSKGLNSYDERYLVSYTEHQAAGFSSIVLNNP